MNEVIKALKERRSIRNFASKEVEQEKIDEIIEAGLYAPSGKGAQAAIIIAITNKEWIAKIKKDNREIMGMDESYDPFYGAPCILCVLADKSCPTSVYDASLVMGNLMLAAHALDLGSIWIHRCKEEFEKKEYKELLKSIGLEGDYEGVGHCAIGYIEGDIPNAKERKENRVFYIK